VHGCQRRRNRASLADISADIDKSPAAGEDFFYQFRFPAKLQVRKAFAFKIAA